MITSDPVRRSARLAETLEVLKKRAAPEDRVLALAFAPVVFAEMPDRLALGLRPEALAARMLSQFRFTAREIPPSFQLYKGLPGIHVACRNLTAEEAVAQGGGQGGLPKETTVVQTHTADMPFIFDSLKNYFRKAGLRVFSAIHPVMSVRRQWERIVGIAGPFEEGSKECVTHFEVERVESKERLRRIEHEVFSVLKGVFMAVEDFHEMVNSCREIEPRLKSRTKDAAQLDSARAFLAWLLDDNYIMMGTLRYRIRPDRAMDRLEETATGVFNDMTLLPVVFPGVIEEIETHLVPRPGDDRIIDVDYCNNAEAIYHIEPIDDVVFREWGEDGRIVGATVLLGRFARGAFAQRADKIPLLKEKHDWLLQQSHAVANSHAWREIRAAFNRFPKTELFYADAADLKAIIDQIVYLTGDDEVAVHCRKGAGYEALYVAFSRLRYSYQTVEALKNAFSEEFGPVAFASSVDVGAVTLYLFYFDGSRLDRSVDPDTVRRLTLPVVTTWEDQVALALDREFGEIEGRRLFNRYIRRETRSGLYREATPAEQVPTDIRHFEALEGQLEVRIMPRTADTAALNLYSVRSLGLTDILRTLQNLGLTVSEELRVPLVLPDNRKAFMYRFEVEGSQYRIATLHQRSERFIEALRALDEERATDDPLNSLVLLAGLSWREVELVRTVRNHLLQIRTHYNAETVNGVLLRNAAAAAAVFRSFAARFDPSLTRDRAAAIADAEAEVRKALDGVKSLAEDEVLRAMDNLVRSALRTNFYQQPERPVLSVKVDSRKVEAMPSPRPMFEIYVHSRLLEGIHLRGGKIARGGIRWSDRHDDFRTEVLGLMKTQMIKNAIIVPVGSKGGFVLKGNVPPRPALDAYLIDRYREYVSGLLDVTDNRVDGQVLHPPEVVRHDGDDPYLVVAADKGTAHLSDTANSVSAQYGFWLDDAFASGGSAGYDHKKMGITARGAWECVIHHFRNLGIDVQKEPHTVVGIGDMAGDVFGNGLLRSRASKLVAAFNHLHIFIDPDPDLERSFAERQRLFDLPRSSWKDYNASLLSRGGGIFDRSAKAIPLSAELKKLLELSGEAASGEEVIRRLLTAKVDLLYNGGIGTYVKASSEEDADVGDRANDRVRVDGKDVRARVLGEGGNLGFTQKGRIECWAGGALLNTDAIDNSGGVDTSDHEVNIKILMSQLMKSAVVRGKGERNRILQEMTGEVAELVLEDNRNQARALTLDGLRSAKRYEEFVSFIADLAGAGVLNRLDDAIPAGDELMALPTRDRGLPRPLLAVVLGHVKNFARSLVLETSFPDGTAGGHFLDAYFPKRLRERYSEHFEGHALRREIISTEAVNHIINHAGVVFFWRVTNQSKADIGEVAAAYLQVERDAEASGLRESLFAAGWKAADEHLALLDVEDALETAVLAALGGKKKTDAAKQLKALRTKLKL